MVTPTVNFLKLFKLYKLTFNPKHTMKVFEINYINNEGNIVCKKLKSINNIAQAMLDFKKIKKNKVKEILSPVKVKTI